ncbi:hypothetical protein C1S80_15350 [Mycolicibacterium aubagnense]|nr:hypothetical protein C1S80_15350 [Mycolicibacterium aubagnense]
MSPHHNQPDLNHAIQLPPFEDFEEAACHSGGIFLSVSVLRARRAPRLKVAFQQTVPPTQQLSWSRCS